MQYTANSLEHQWIPFTVNKNLKSNPRLVVKGDGVL
jgi:adenosylmethionine-8-amino-7-oxononanoate aminotransferase